MIKMPLHYDAKAHYLYDADNDFVLDCGDANMPVEVAEQIAAATQEGRQKPVLDAKTAMRLAKESYASTSDEKDVRNSMPTPAPYITMTAGNLLKFFQLASKDYKP